MAEPTGLSLVLILTAVFVGAIVQGSVGFGFALVSAGAFGLIEPRAIPGTLLLLSFPINVYVGLRERRALDTEGLRDVVIGLVIGTPVGALVLALVPAQQLAVAFGAAIVAASALSVARPDTEPGSRGRILGGGLSAVITTVASTGGPAIALLFHRRRGPQLRATLAAAFLISGAFSTIAVAAAGRLGWVQARLALIVVPAMAAGLLTSSRVAERLDQRWLRPAVLVFAAGSGIAAMVRGLV